MFICFQQMTIFSPVVAFLLLVSSALVLDVAIYFRRNEKEFNDKVFLICEKEPCGNVEAAGVSITFIALLSPRFQLLAKIPQVLVQVGNKKAKDFFWFYSPSLSSYERSRASPSQQLGVIPSATPPPLTTALDITTCTAVGDSILMYTFLNLSLPNFDQISKFHFVKF